jgi:outer membrane protein TolC
MPLSIPDPSRSILPILALPALLFGCHAPTRDEAPALRALAQDSAGHESLPVEDRLSRDSTLEDLLAYALRSSPRLAAAHERHVAMLEMAPQARSLPDPQIRARYFVEEVQTRVGPQEYALGVSQTLPGFGKRGKRGELALARARVEEARVLETRLELVAEIRESWYELYYLERSLSSLRESRGLYAHWVEVLQTRYAAGESTYADLIRAQVELDLLDDRVARLADESRPLEARLNAALHREETAELPTPAEIGELAELLPGAELRRLLLERAPQLVALAREREAEALAVELAEIETRPDFTLGVDYIGTGEAVSPGLSGSGDDPLVVSLSFDLPVYSERDRAAKREAQARERAARQRVAAEVDRRLAQLESSLFAVHDAQRRIALYRDTLVPRARQAQQATEAAFRAGDAGLGDLIDSERVRLEVELSLERARTDLAVSITRLERQVGAPVTRETAARADEGA